MIAFEVLSLLSATFVLSGLLWILFHRKEFIVRPSYIFLGVFWIQVQFASAINAADIYVQLSAPWIYFLLIHFFAIAILLLLPFTFQRTTMEVSAKIRGWSKHATLVPLVGRATLLLCLVWLVFAGYLSYVPFRQTGLHALLFEPQLADEHRELSMKLANLQWFNYLYAIMEKVLAPMAGAYMGLIIALSWRRSRRLLAPIAVLGILVVTFPTMIYGARGPAVMVFAAAALALLVTRRQHLTPWPFLAAFAVALLPAVVTMALKSGSFGPKVLLFQAGNVLDRAVGRTFCDGVSHVAYAQENGFHGIGAIEKLAPLFGVQPVDFLNKVGAQFYGQCRPFGPLFLRFGQDPPIPAIDLQLNRLRRGLTLEEDLARSRMQPAEAKLKLEQELVVLERRKADDAAAIEQRRGQLAVNLRETVSAGASFVVLNYSMFGPWSIVLSLGFVVALDLLLFAYGRMPAEGAVVAVAGSVVPILTLCFSLFTTVLASKGLLAVPLVAWLVALVPDPWFSLSHWRGMLSRLQTFLNSG